MLKKTRVISYNLADRDRAHTGTDRSDLDIASMIERINAPDTQELVKNGDMFGYYGHETRARFGMNPPDVWVNPQTGENIRIEPAFRTIKLSASSDGTVTTQHEFLETDAGKYSLGLYSSNAGGFSSAIIRRKNNTGLYDVTGFHGYDYVNRPNYNTNRGGGMFDALFVENADGEMAFDSTDNITPERAALLSALETAILSQFDSISTALSSQTIVNHYQNEAMAAQNALINRDQKLEQLRQKRAARELEVFDSLICPSQPFSELVADWDGFMSQGTSDNDLKTSQQAKQETTTAQRERPRVFRHR